MSESDRYSGDTARDEDTTLAALVYKRWGIRPRMTSHWFNNPDWWYEDIAAHTCDACGGKLHAFRRTYDGPLGPGQTTRGKLIAVVCPQCPDTFQLRDLGIRSFAHLMDPQAPRRRSGNASAPAIRSGSCDVPAGQSGVSVRTISVGAVPDMLARLLNTPDTRVIAGNDDELLTASHSAHNRLHWVKINDPRSTLPAPLTDTDVRVLLPIEPEFDPLARQLEDSGIPHRRVRYWIEDEIVSNMHGGRPSPLRVTTANAATNPTPEPSGEEEFLRQLRDAFAARDAFKLIWDSHEPATPDSRSVPCEALTPSQWLSYLPHTALNPAQAQAAPKILSTNSPVVVTAPTGAGKTVIGMLAALKAMLSQGGKAAWLVPQRSLTAELDRELGRWRELGIRVERLSGDHIIDRARIRRADMWVATTEKFESLCRTESLQSALAQVRCLVVDEIHLLGDAQRGPVLEALLTRLSESGSSVRLVGLSATVSNAHEIASWLRAELVSVTWRPSRLTWQLPLIADSDDRKGEQAARTERMVELTKRVTADDGSVLVFCGTKYNVRAAALALASARGADTRGVEPDDLDRLERACTSVGVGIHYKDWEHKQAAERGFRAHEIDVLVATTTVAAGVNLPARAVIVRDTQLGTGDMDIATVQQMFGRAGRIGAGETEGWAFLLTTGSERPDWQRQLTDGYVAQSQIVYSLADHVLAEATQGRIRTLDDCLGWWQKTLACHQGNHDLEPVKDAVDLLLEHGYMVRDDAAADEVSATLSVTSLGRLTAQLMVNVVTGINVTTVLRNGVLPRFPEDAERLLAGAIATEVPQLAEAPINDGFRSRVSALLQADGRPENLDEVPEDTQKTGWLEPGDLAQCAFLLLANNPRGLARARRAVAGIPTSVLLPIYTEAPRYFSWLARQGAIGTVHPWISITAADLGRRIRWRTSAAPRGSGRLLWICEEMATRESAETLVPRLFHAARDAGYTAPDWESGTPPRSCQLRPDSYNTLLSSRATGTRLTTNDGVVTAHLPCDATVITWSGPEYNTFNAKAGRSQFDYPNPDSESQGVAIFTARGDYYANGWLSSYNGHVSDQD